MLIALSISTYSRHVSWSGYQKEEVFQKHLFVTLPVPHEDNISHKEAEQSSDS